MEKNKQRAPKQEDVRNTQERRREDKKQPATVKPSKDRNTAPSAIPLDKDETIGIP